MTNNVLSTFCNVSHSTATTDRNYLCILQYRAIVTCTNHIWQRITTPTQNVHKQQVSMGQFINSSSILCRTVLDSHSICCSPILASQSLGVQVLRCEMLRYVLSNMISHHLEDYKLIISGFKRVHDHSFISSVSMSQFCSLLFK